MTEQMRANAQNLANSVNEIQLVIKYRTESGSITYTNETTYKKHYQYWQVLEVIVPTAWKI